MSKMKELDHIADCVVDIVSEHLEHNIAWVADDTIFNKDNVFFCEESKKDAIHHIRQAVVRKLNTKYNG